jgi:polyphenol oxidase
MRVATLFDTTRAVGPNDRIPMANVGPTVMKAILGSKSFADFGGSAQRGAFRLRNPRQMGTTRGGSARTRHLWTTDPKNFSGLADMGMLAAASFDPMFFAHHANLDRLWSV